MTIMGYTITTQNAEFWHFTEPILMRSHCQNIKSARSSLSAAASAGTSHGATCRRSLAVAARRQHLVENTRYLGVLHIKVAARLKPIVSALLQHADSVAPSSADSTCRRSNQCHYMHSVADLNTNQAECGCSAFSADVICSSIERR